MKKLEAVEDKNESALVQGASIYFCDSFIEVHSQSGGHVGMLDRNAFDVFLPPEVSDDRILNSMLAALEASHSWWPEKFVASGGWRGAESRRKEWIAELIRRFPEKRNKSILFRGLRWLEIKRRHGVVTFFPKNRVSGDGYGFLPGRSPTDHLKFIVESPDDQSVLQQSLRLAMQNCCDEGVPLLGG